MTSGRCLLKASVSRAPLSKRDPPIAIQLSHPMVAGWRIRRMNRVRAKSTSNLSYRLAENRRYQPKAESSHTGYVVAANCSIAKGDKMMAVEVTASPSFSAGKPKLLFEIPLGDFYDVTSDGERFIATQPVEAE